MPTTLRRIKKLEAEQRQAQRRLDGTDRFYDYGNPASGAYRERLLILVADRDEQLAYWREHVRKAQEEAGVKVWSAADFTKGDYVRFLGTWYEVLRVNAKSLTIPAMINDGNVVTKANSRLHLDRHDPLRQGQGPQERRRDRISSRCGLALPPGSSHNRCASHRPGTPRSAKIAVRGGT